MKKLIILLAFTALVMSCEKEPDLKMAAVNLVDSTKTVNPLPVDTIKPQSKFITDTAKKANYLFGKWYDNKWKYSCVISDSIYREGGQFTAKFFGDSTQGLTSPLINLDTVNKSFTAYQVYNNDTTFDNYTYYMEGKDTLHLILRSANRMLHRIR